MWRLEAGVCDLRGFGRRGHAGEEGETGGQCYVAAALRAALRRRGGESVTRGDWDGEDTRWRKARRLDGATLLRLLEPRSEDAEAGLWRGAVWTVRTRGGGRRDVRRVLRCCGS